MLNLLKIRANRNLKIVNTSRKIKSEQSYMRRHGQGARNGPNNAGGAWNPNLTGAIYDLQKMREMKKTALHNLNVYMNYAFDLLTKACLFEHRGPIPEPGRLRWDICFNYARQKSLTRQWIYQTFFLPPPLSCPSLLSRVWDDSHSVEGNRRCV